MERVTNKTPKKILFLKIQSLITSIFPSRTVKNVVDFIKSMLTASSIRIYRSGNNKKIRLKNRVPNEVPTNKYFVIVNSSMCASNKVPHLIW